MMLVLFTNGRGTQKSFNPLQMGADDVKKRKKSKKKKAKRVDETEDTKKQEPRSSGPFSKYAKVLVFLGTCLYLVYFATKSPSNEKEPIIPSPGHGGWGGTRAVPLLEWMCYT